MSKKKVPVSVDRDGGLIYNGLNSDLRQKYNADTPLDRSFVPYLVMLFCGIVDTSVFINLFSNISYESPFMLAIQVAGLLFAFDIVPIYIGIQLRRIKQGLTSDRFIMWFAISVCALGFATNVILRILTMNQISPDLGSTAVNFYGSVVEETQTATIDSTVIALTIFNIILPILTSIGSFFISYLTYNPIKVRKRALEKMINEKKDEIRKLDALLLEYSYDPRFYYRSLDTDKAMFNATKQTYRALVMSYCDYVREFLKEHIGTPNSNNALSQENCSYILSRLDKELAEFNISDAYDTNHSDNSSLYFDDPGIDPPFN